MSATLEQAVALHRAGRLPEAERAYREVLQASPRDPDALHLLGAVKTDRGDFTAAADLIARAIALRPGSPVFHYNLGNAERGAGRADAAIAAYRRELEINPGFTKAVTNLVGMLTNRGADLMRRGATTRAEAALRDALAIEPAAFAALENLALLLTGVDRFDEAFAVYERALTLDPKRITLWRNLLPAILYHPRLDNTQRFAWHERFATLARAAAGPLPAVPLIARDAGKRLRVAWLSSDFRAHPVARNLMPMLTHRNRDRFEAFLYSDVEHPDAVTERMRALADQWRPVRSVDDANVAQMMREDGIDILVILAGHFDDNRPTVALHRAAPVQIGFHDAATSGLAEIDYLIADPALAPRGSDERFTERVVRLPSFYTHAPLTDAPAPERSAGPPRFAAFANPSKINGRTVALWARVLQRLPEWGLALKYRNSYAAADLCARLTSAFAAHGIGAERVDFATRVDPLAAHLAAYAGVDIALDTAPFNGSTSSFEALWMGVPLVTLRGDAMAGRWGAAILSAIDRRAWIAEDETAFIEIAAALAERRAELAGARENLRATVAESPLCDEPARARQIERLLRAVWRRACGSGDGR